MGISERAGRTRVAQETGQSERRGRADPPTCREAIDSRVVAELVAGAFSGELHKALEASVVAGVIGVVEAGALGVSLIGHALAGSEGLESKHAIKQVDRLLSNRNLQLEQLDLPWVRFVLAERREVVIALDWTEYAKDGHHVIAANAITSHGRATPLCWKTVPSAELTDGGRRDAEDVLLLRLRSAIPNDVRVTIVADRGFGDSALYEFLAREQWDFVIRFRECIHVRTASADAAVPAAELVAPNGRARMFKNVGVTAKSHPVAAVVTVKAAGMKDAWCLATSRVDLSASQAVAMYGRRFTIEETFRDTKDPRFGLGLEAVRLKRPDRRDRLILLAALAQALLTLLGAASEATGLDRTLKANTVTKRTHSLFRQGCLWFKLLRNARPDRRDALVLKFGEILREHQVFREIFGIL